VTVVCATAVSRLLAVLVVLAGGCLLVVVAVRWLFAPVALVLEETKPLAALKRSWRLTKNDFWRILGIGLLTNLLISIANGTISQGFLIANSLFNPSLGASVVLDNFASTIAATLLTPFTASAIALLYIDLRIRREAFDLVLIQASGH
ncbi:MAG: glycerophosphoryl diester phosphodiesterase membrane domain-containing protein, partial [Bifidobacteriaceae bacterium]|jgi:membrane-anchored glycerophosphoryl diester phosphodiesterase (GDPDase)|nr:glycerophosphoryl diester phosphodiesterase membrane domain-containing protein [Bifidobacteriaceae bacterium]